MKLGAKISGKKEMSFLEKVIGSIDFIEIIARRNQDYDFLKNFGKKIVIHVEHQVLGINPADNSKYSRNLETIIYALKLADELKANKVVCHPGIILNPNCSEEVAINFFKSINDDRILIENMPLLNYRGRVIDALCALPAETETFLKKSNKKLCLDISHAIVSALIKDKADYNEFIMPYLELKPVHFHFSDVLLEKKRDHLHFGEGNLNIGYYKKILPEDAEITLETRKNAEKVLDDIRIIKSYDTLVYSLT